MLFYELEKIRELRMRSVYFRFLFICSFFIIFACSHEKDINKQFIQNYAPKYAGSEFITLEKLYKIPIDEFDKYFISEIWSMDVDRDTNLYVLDYWESTVTVFDKNGKFLRTMGGVGRGPGELEKPGSLSIHNGKIYIYQWFKGIKILDLQGDYLDFFIKSNLNFGIDLVI